MRVDQITIERVDFGELGIHDDVVILWTEDGQPHTLPDVDHNVSYPTRLASGESFKIVEAHENGSSQK